MKKLFFIIMAVMLLTAGAAAGANWQRNPWQALATPISKNSAVSSIGPTQ